MIEWINNLSDGLFILFVVTVFLAVIQLVSLARHVKAGSGASVIPGILAVVGIIILFTSTH